MRRFAAVFLCFAMLLPAFFTIAGSAFPVCENAPRGNTVMLDINSKKFDPVCRPIPFRSDLLVKSSTVWVVQMKGPVLTEWRDALDSTGAERIGYVSEFAYVVRASPDAIGRLGNMPFVRYIGPFHPAYKITGDYLNELESSISPSETAIVETFGDAAAFLAGPSSFTGIVSSITPHSFTLAAPPRTILSLIFNDNVLYVVKMGQPANFWDIVDIKNYTGVDYAAGLGFKGAGILVSVADGGCHYTHNAFGGPSNAQPDGSNTQIYKYAAFGVALEDSSGAGGGHGTCTASLIAGIDPGHVGIAPESKLLVQNGGTYVGSSYTIATGAQSSLENNSVIHSNSWGGFPYDGQYWNYAQENDQVMWDNPQFLFLYAAGNGGKDVGYASLQRYAASKNVFCIGANLDAQTLDRSDDYYIANLMINGNSYLGPSQGPAADGRIKPDIVAPYWFYNASTCLNDTGYVPFGGTSGATPMCAGIAAIIDQAYKANHFGTGGGNLPSSALTRAIMVASAYQMDLANANRTEQGWGEADVKKAIDIGTAGLLVNDTDNPGLNTAGTKSFTYNVGSSISELKITLAWTDPPATATGASKTLVNDLDLNVTDPLSTVYLGNRGLMTSKYSQSGGTPATDSDRLNNMENVFIQNPPQGQYTIEVSGYNVPSGPQPYALAVVGAAGSAPPQVLDHVTVTPTPASVETSKTQVFTAKGYNSTNTEIPGLTFDWSVTGAIGSVNPASSSGTTTFTAAGSPGTGTVVATATHNSVTKQGSADVTVYNTSSPLAVFVTAPAGGEIWNATPHNIGWTVANGSPPYSVDIFYSLNGGTDYSKITSVVQASPGQDMYSWTPGAVNSQSAKILVWVNDSKPANQTATSAVFTLDTSKPTIIHTPVTSGTTGSQIAVTGNILDNFNVISANLFVKGVGQGAFTSAPMTLTSGNVTDGTYNANIPAQATAGTLEYYLNATDGVNEEKTTTYSVTITNPPAGTGNISGHVIDNASAAINGASVFIYKGAVLCGSATSDAAGYYLVSGLQPDTYSAVANKTGYVNGTNSGISVSAGATATSDFALVPVQTGGQTGTVTGTITDNQSFPLAGVRVDLKSGASVIKTTTTVTGGLYTITGVQAGTYSMLANKTGYIDGTKTRVTVTAGLSIQEDFALRPISGGNQKGSIAGAVTDENLYPLPSAAVYVMSGSTVVQSGTTDAGGQYTIANVQAGAYSMIANLTGYVNDSKTSVVVTAGVQTTAGFMLYSWSKGSQLGTIAGNVTDRDGGPLVGVLVEIISGSTTVRSATTNAGGSYVIATIMQGSYTAKASKNGYVSASKPVTVTAQETSVLDFSMAKVTTPPPPPPDNGMPIWLIAVIGAVIAVVIIVALAILMKKKKKQEPRGFTPQYPPYGPQPYGYQQQPPAHPGHSQGYSQYPQQTQYPQPPYLQAGRHGWQQQVAASACPYCHSPMQPNMQYCPNCHNSLIR